MNKKIDILEDLEMHSNEVIVKLENPFIDERGEIQPLVDSLMKSAVLIRSNPNTLRANHYHKTDWHYCYVIKGKIEYFHRPVNSIKEPELIIVEKENMIFTPPMVEHCMKFPLDTLFLTLSRNPRDQKTYEEDTVRIDFMNNDNRF